MAKFNFTYEGSTYTFEGTPLEVANKQRTVKAAQEKMEGLVALSTKRGRGRPRIHPEGPSRSQVIREWAKENGLEVGARGRLTAEVVEAFEKAQG